MQVLFNFDKNIGLKFLMENHSSLRRNKGKKESSAEKKYSGGILIEQQDASLS